MAKISNPFRGRFDDFVVTWSCHPTEKDNIGCDGMYIESAKITRQFEIRMWIASRLIALGAWILGARIRIENDNHNHS